MPKRDWQKDWDLCQKATSGPWYAIRHPEYLGADWCISTKPDAPWESTNRLAYIGGESNARFITEAREALPYWLQRVQKLETESAMMRDILQRILPGAMFASCRYASDKDADPNFHCCTWSEIVEEIRRVLFGTAGRDEEYARTVYKEYHNKSLERKKEGE